MKSCGKQLLALALVAVLTILPFGNLTVSAAAPDIALDRAVYAAADTITVTYSGTDTNDWTGLYPAGLLPGSGKNSLDWTYTVGSGTVTFSAASLDAGDYIAYLCDNDGYAVLDRVHFTVRGTDTTDYGVKAASVNATVANGKTELSVTVTPSSAATLTYRFWWAKNGVRLDDYLPIKEFTHSGASTFTAECNDCLFMPAEANSIEVAVVEGHSTSVFAAAPDKLKVPSSTYRYSFQVLTDLHVSPDLPAHVPNLKAAFADVAALSPDSTAIFTVGDNTDRGTQAHYDLLLKTLSELTVDLPPIYFAIGNHDEVYGGTYEEEVARFLDNLKMPGLYYAVDMNDTRFLILASEEQTTAGTISDTQIKWVEEQLAATDPTKPVFLFLHQPLKDTVSGTLTWTGEAHQRWYLGASASEKLHAILKNYPNAVFFSGHTHSSFLQQQPMLYGEGVGASFVNAASTAYLWNDKNEDFAGSQGLYVEVYEDYILVKGRDFTNAKWCASAQFLIPLNAASNACDGDLVGGEGSWSYDSGVMQVNKTAYATEIYNTDGAWPKADFTFDKPITFDPQSTALYVDMVLEEDASANIYLLGQNNAALSLSPYIPKMTVTESGDLVGNGRRVRGVINMSDMTPEAGLVNASGTITINRTRVYASGAANAKLTIYDLSLVNARSAKTVSLMNPDTLQTVDSDKQGGFVYDNGKLTVTNRDSGVYRVSFALDESYNVSTLRNLLVKAQATTAFDVAVTATTLKDDTTFSLAADFWPELCDAKDNGYIPAGTYEKALNFYSSYTYNGIAPENGISTFKIVTVTLSGAGSVTLDALQLSSVTAVQTMQDGVYLEMTTPTAVIGDVNGDGEVTTADARDILLYVVEAIDFNDAQKQSGDADGDGTVTTSDARELLIGIVNQ